jgi:hypothetical protein
MRSARLLGLIPIVIAFASGCGGGEPLSPRRIATATTPSASVLPIDVLGASHVPGGLACKTVAYHQFDFWIGNWDVYSPAGALAGTNVVKSRLGGCVVEENWTGANLGHGRSLNFYDVSTDTWSQMWVSSGGCPTGVIMVEGGFANGSMTMTGSKAQPEGFVLAPPCAPPPPVVSYIRTNRIRWTAIAGSVVQESSVSNNGDPLPPLGAPSLSSGLRYDPVSTITPLDPPDPSFCPSRVAAHQFDFMLGSWRVHEGNGNGAQATVVVTSDLRGCLIEENFDGPGGYEGLSYNTFDVYTQKWHRTWVDTDGQRLVLSGGFENGSMVLTGTKLTAGGQTVTVRLTWTPDGLDRVVQRWEFSRDGGDAWSSAKELVYTRES